MLLDTRSWPVKVELNSDAEEVEEAGDISEIQAAVDHIAFLDSLEVKVACLSVILE